jgi:hypothetical protein
VPVDDHTVVFASATESEIKSALVVLDRKQPITWDSPTLAETNELLPADADWRFFFNPRSYFAWSQKQSAVTSGPAIGGRPNREFPTSPPIGAAARTSDSEIIVTVVVPAATVHSAGAYLKK